MIRAAVACMTWDEGYTYVIYIRGILDSTNPIREFFRVYIHSIANNHLLNTFAITLVDMITGETYNEFIIRIPSLLFCCFYVWLLGKKYSSGKISFLTYLLLITNGYLSNYFSVGRGYGMSCTFILLACISLKDFVDESDINNQIRIFIYISIYSILAEMANTISFLTVFPLYVMMIYTLIRNKSIKNFLVRIHIIPFSFIAISHLVLLLYHLLISRKGAPLYMGEDGFFISFLAGYGRMYDLHYAGKIAMVLLPFCFLIYVLWRKKELTKDIYICAFILYVLISLGACSILKNGVLTGRLLIPSIPLMAFALGEVMSRKKYKRINYINVIMALIFVLMYIGNLNISFIRDYEVNENDRQFVHELMRDHKTLHDYGIENSEHYLFYIHKFRNMYGYELL